MDKKHTDIVVPDAAQGLDAHSDHDLRALIARATALLETRAVDRRKLAIADIQRLARENGLTISVGQPARKRGRPRKDATATCNDGE